MGKITFGQKKTMANKIDMATKRGYDTGKKSTGSASPSKWRVKPTASGGKIGIQFKKKM